MSGDLSGFSLMDLFRGEAETHTAALAAGLLALEGPGAAAPETVAAMMRAAHSVKGAARVVGLEPAVKVAHALEDCFVAAEKRGRALDPSQADVLLRAVDFLSRAALVTDARLDGWTAESAAEVARLVAEVGAVTAEQGREVPPVRAEEPAPSPPPPAPEAGPAPAPPDPAEAPAADDASAAAPEPADRVVRVTAESLTRLMGLAGESLVQSQQLRPFLDSLLALKAQQSALVAMLEPWRGRADGGPVGREVLDDARAQAVRCTQMLSAKVEEFDELARRNEDLSGRLHHEVLASRMRPLADGVRGFPRMVRDVARSLGKSVKFEVVGENVGVDRDVLEALEAPLNHLIRNAIDHAIEPPGEREAAGKPASGTVRLSARHRAGMLHVTLSDDGRGVDPKAVRSRVVERGLVSASMAGQLTEAELLEFLFLPGFSTKDRVTEISGRGVGLDVVQNAVRAANGFVRVTSQVGVGTRFTLQLPITLSVIRALLVRIAGEPYAFPLNRIDRIVMLPRESVRVLEGRPHFMMDGQAVGLVEACQVLDLPRPEHGADAYSVVVASDRSHRFGVVVDAFLGERDLEVRPLDPRLGKVPDVNSASVLEDGWPVLIIDVEDLVRSVDNLLGGRRLRGLDGPAPGGEAKGPRRVLVVDDSITVRELERQLLENAGYAVEVAVDGLDGWNAVRGGDFHLVISDVDMPRMDGIQLVTLVKQDPRLRSVPVVIVSYKDREEDRMRGLDAGANAYLTKSSFHDQTFLKTVFDLIGGAAP